MTGRAAGAILEVADQIQRGEISQFDAARILQGIASQIEPEEIPGKVRMAAEPSLAGHVAVAYRLGRLEREAAIAAADVTRIADEMLDGPGSGQLQLARFAERLQRAADRLFQELPDWLEHLADGELLAVLVRRGRIHPSRVELRAHEVVVGRRGWTLFHPLSCPLEPCPFHEAALEWDGPPVPPGRWRWEEDAQGGPGALQKMMSRPPDPSGDEESSP